ncbi:MAG: hypothetical protein ABL904_00615 [Hyphomicrobiaceae bacterium]
MAFVTGDIVASEDTEFPFKVVFKQGEEVVQEWLAQSREDAEEQIIEALRGLGDFTDSEPEAKTS